jgi:hypothetical protein
LGLGVWRVAVQSSEGRGTDLHAGRPPDLGLRVGEDWKWRRVLSFYIMHREFVFIFMDSGW